MIKPTLTLKDSIHLRVPKIENLKRHLILKYPGMKSSKLNEGITDMGGVYFLFDKEGSLLYIGQSQDIERRLKSHLRVEAYSTTYYVGWIIESQSYLRLALESLYIGLYKPVLNHSFRRLPENNIMLKKLVKKQEVVE